MKNKIDLKKFKEVVGQLKTKQRQLQGLMNRETLNEARRVAEASGQELKKVKDRLLKEAGEIRKLQSALPGELAKLTRFVERQRKELERLLRSVRSLEEAVPRKARRSPRKPAGKASAAAVVEKSVKVESPAESPAPNP